MFCILTGKHKRLPALGCLQEGQHALPSHWSVRREKISKKFHVFHLSEFIFLCPIQVTSSPSASTWTMWGTQPSSGGMPAWPSPTGRWPCRGSCHRCPSSANSSWDLDPPRRPLCRQVSSQVNVFLLTLDWMFSLKYLFWLQRKKKKIEENIPTWDTKCIFEKRIVKNESRKSSIMDINNLPSCLDAHVLVKKNKNPWCLILLVISSHTCVYTCTMHALFYAHFGMPLQP